MRCSALGLCAVLSLCLLPALPQKADAAWQNDVIAVISLPAYDNTGVGGTNGRSDFYVQAVLSVYGGMPGATGSTANGSSHTTGTWRQKFVWTGGGTPTGSVYAYADLTGTLVTPFVNGGASATSIWPWFTDSTNRAGNYEDRNLLHTYTPTAESGTTKYYVDVKLEALASGTCVNSTGSKAASNGDTMVQFRVTPL